MINLTLMIEPKNIENDFFFFVIERKQYKLISKPNVGKKHKPFFVSYSFII